MKTAFITTLSFFLFTTYGLTQIEAIGAARMNETINMDPGGHPVVINNYQERAAGDIIVADDFADFTNWLSVTEDGTTAEWTWESETPAVLENHMGTMTSTTHENGFAAFNGVQYLLDTDVDIQNASLEYQPVINCVDANAVTLSFEQRYRGFNFEKTYVEVSNNAGVSYDFIYEVNTNSYVNEKPIQETITLNITEAAAGNSDVKIRFRWEESSGDDMYGSGYAWLIDDFVVSEGWNADLKITDVFMQSGVGGLIENGMTYYHLYEYQTTEIELSAKVENFAGIEQINAKLNVEVTGPSGHVCMSESTDLEIAAKDSLFCSSAFTPSGVGVYEVKFWFDSDLDEDFVSNDTIVRSIVVGSEEYNDYARHDGIETGSIANVLVNSGSPLLIGNLMQFFDVSEFREVTVNISDDSTNIGQLIYVQLMKYNTDLDEFTYIDQTEDHIITVSNLGTVVSLYFEENQCYKENEYGLILVGHYGGTNQVRFSLAQDVEEKTVLGFMSGETEPFYLENPQALMIQIKNLEYGYCNISVAEYEGEFGLYQNYPNPFYETTTIEYELANSDNVQITFNDISGKRIKTLNINNQSAGKHYINLNATDFAEGIYFYTVNVGGQSLTKRMIVL